jgi:hypothetical protein
MNWLWLFSGIIDKFLLPFTKITLFIINSSGSQVMILEKLLWLGLGLTLKA